MESPQKTLFCLIVRPCKLLSRGRTGTSLKVTQTQLWCLCPFRNPGFRVWDFTARLLLPKHCRYGRSVGRSSRPSKCPQCPQRRPCRQCSSRPPAIDPRARPSENHWLLRWKAAQCRNKGLEGLVKVEASRAKDFRTYGLCGSRAPVPMRTLSAVVLPKLATLPLGGTTKGLPLPSWAGMAPSRIIYFISGGGGGGGGEMHFVA